MSLRNLHRLHLRCLAALLGLVGVLSTSSLHAATAYSLINTELGNVTHNTNTAYGFAFTVHGGIHTYGIDVTSLGAFDYNTNAGNINGLNGPGFAADQQVRLWSAAGDLLASATIPAASSNSNDFVYVGITPVHLAPGSYVISVYSNTPGDTRDGRLVFQTSAFAIGISPAGPRDSNQGGDIFPANTPPLATIYNGPNFTFEPSSIPEPASLVFLSLAAATLLRRR